MSIDALLDFDEMPSWETLVEANYLSTADPVRRFFVSHPWESLEFPDPVGRQWKTLQRIFTKGLGPSPRDVDSPIVVVRGTSGGYALANSSSAHVFSAFSNITPASFDRFLAIIEHLVPSHASPSPPMSVQDAYRTFDSMLWGNTGIRCFQEKVRSGRPISDEERKRLQDSIGIWLDFCCVPQGRENVAEEQYFQTTIRCLTSLASTSTVLAIWPDENAQLKRAWCVAETAINKATTHHGASRPNGFVVPDSGYLADKNESLLEDLSIAAVNTIESLNQHGRSSKDPTEIISWFQQQDIRSTSVDDLPLIAGGVFAAVSPAWRISKWAAVLALASRIAECCWWIIALPLVIISPFVTLIGLAMRSVTRGAEVRGAQMPIVIVLAMPAFYCAMLGGTVAMLLAPLEIARRRFVKGLLIERGKFVQGWSDGDGPHITSPNQAIQRSGK